MIDGVCPLRLHITRTGKCCQSVPAILFFTPRALLEATDVVHREIEHGLYRHGYVVQVGRSGMVALYRLVRHGYVVQVDLGSKVVRWEIRVTID